MLTERIGEAFTRPMGGLVRVFAHVSPNVLTIIGLALNGVACALFALSGGKDYARPDLLRLGGAVTLVAAVFDMLDGRVARLRGRETSFGAYLESTMDRYSDNFVFDNQILADSLIAGVRVGEISCPARYFAEASSINFRRSIVYGLGVLQTSLRGLAVRLGLMAPPFQLKRPAASSSVAISGRA